MRVLMPVCVFVFSAAACGGRARPAEKVNIDPVPLLVWADGDADIRAEDLLRGCREWRPKGIACHPVREKWKSDVQVYVDREDPCEPGENGRRTLARAWKGGRVVFYHSCFLKDGEIDRHMVRAISVHEIGHQLGIWEHIPEDCGESAREHPSGRRICGEAVMNPLYEKDVHFVTEIDALAFDLRDRSIGVVEDRGDLPEREPDCVYYTRP